MNQKHLNCVFNIGNTMNFVPKSSPRNLKWSTCCGSAHPRRFGRQDTEGLATYQDDRVDMQKLIFPSLSQGMEPVSVFWRPHLKYLEYSQCGVH